MATFPSSFTAADLIIECLQDGRLRIFATTTDPPVAMPSAPKCHSIGGDAWKAGREAMLATDGELYSDEHGMYFASKTDAAKALAAAKQAVSK